MISESRVSYNNWRISMGYHYSHNAHTYVKHAWRASELKNFFDNLISHFGIMKG